MVADEGPIVVQMSVPNTKTNRQLSPEETAGSHCGNLRQAW